MGDASDIATAQRADARRFAAFISYSHADADAAAKLQRRLERYRLPKRVAAARTNSATSLGPIFRDREDLAAAASLSAAIRDAIGRADALVVMCSPEAAASPWVAAEIELFRELHPDRPILAALLSGEPAVSFPPALTADGNEPLAADLRPEGDGAQLGFLKIVAGIVGVPLDTLIQRDAQRRIRRVTAITASAVTAMLIMAIMTAYAIQARNEAARQRAAAEGLVEYMLTDLREKLKGVGRLDIMDAVNERAMVHYGAQGDISKLPADSLERRARVLHAMGEDYEKRGELPEASEKFREAYLVTAALLNREPKNPNRVFAHAQSEYWVGRIAQLKKDWATAKTRYESYLRLAMQLRRLAGDRKIALLELGHAHLNLGIVGMGSAPQPKTARHHFRQAIAAYENAGKLGPETSEQVYYRSNTAAWIADSYFAERDFARSLQYRDLELRLNRQVATSDASNANAGFLVAKTRFALAKNLMKTGNIARAQAELLLASNQMKGLTSIDPSNDEWGYQYFRIVSNLAIAAHQRDDKANAQDSLRAAVAMQARYRDNPEITAKMRTGMDAVRNAMQAADRVQQAQ